MKDVSGKDFYEVRKMGIIPSTGYSYLYDFYCPLIGVNCCGLYSFLAMEANSRSGELLSHEALLSKAMISNGQFYIAMESLEAVGLIKTYLKEDKSLRIFYYDIYPPKNPEQFGKDVLLMGTLRKYLGKDACKELLSRYKKLSPSEGKEVTANFQSVFHPDFDDPSYSVKGDELIGEGGGKLETGFDMAMFKTYVQKNGIAEETLSKKELEKISSLATLYGITPESMCEMVVSCYDESKRLGSKLDLDNLSKLASDTLRFSFLKGKQGESAIYGESALAQKIKMMDETNPIDYLKIRTPGSKPPKSDLSIIEKLVTETSLPQGPINALIDFSLETNDNILSAKSCEKLAAALVRAGVDNARDAMEFLRNVQKKRNSYAKKSVAESKYQPKASPKAAPAEAEVVIEAKEKEEYSDEEVKALLDKLYND